MTKRELIEALEEFPDDWELEFDYGIDEKGRDRGSDEILSVQEEDGVIYLCPFDSEDESEDGEVIDVPFREVAIVGNRNQSRAAKSK